MLVDTAREHVEHGLAVLVVNHHCERQGILPEGVDHVLEDVDALLLGDRVVDERVLAVVVAVSLGGHAASFEVGNGNFDGSLRLLDGHVEAE